MGLNISLAPEVIFHIGSFPITNAFFVSIFVTVIVLAVFLLIANRFQTVPTRFQALVEILFEEAFDFVESIIGNREKAKRIFPLVFTMFIFILFANLLTYIPGQAAVTLKTEEGVMPLFRAAMADYGVVFMMTMVSVILMQIVAIAVHGPFGYLGKFFNFKGPLDFFLGLMDIVGEIAKIVSLSFRLFGNIFAGEVLGAVMLFLAPYFIPLPFMFLGLLTAFVQAFVFSVLTLVFISMASTIEEDELVEEASI
ncbi:MAG: F0F1 ATP synthase subunit A [Candidatus Moranbacteria bacterium]|nr:F0F1 ATP synthase subunit A [Candidatus Moranbacteria bacterium]